MAKDEKDEGDDNVPSPRPNNHSKSKEKSRVSVRSSTTLNIDLRSEREVDSG